MSEDDNILPSEDVELDPGELDLANRLITGIKRALFENETSTGFYHEEEYFPGDFSHHLHSVLKSPDDRYILGLTYNYSRVDLTSRS